MNNFFTHVTSLAYRGPIFKDEIDKQKAASKFAIRIERICIKDNEALFAPVRFQDFEE